MGGVLGTSVLFCTLYGHERGEATLTNVLLNNAEQIFQATEKLAYFVLSFDEAKQEVD